MTQGKVFGCSELQKVLIFEKLFKSAKKDLNLQKMLLLFYRSENAESRKSS